MILKTTRFWQWLNNCRKSSRTWNDFNGQNVSIKTSARFSSWNMLDRDGLTQTTYYKKRSFNTEQYSILRIAESTLHFTPWQTCSNKHHLDFCGKHPAMLQCAWRLLIHKYHHCLQPSTRSDSWVNWSNVQWTNLPKIKSKAYNLEHRSCTLSKLHNLLKWRSSKA